MSASHHHCGYDVRVSRHYSCALKEDICVLFSIH